MSNDIRIKTLMDKVAEKKKAMGDKPKGALETNGLFKYEDGKPLNLNTITDETKAVDVLRHLLLRSSAHTLACEQLDVEVPFVWNGFTVDQWVDDLKMKISLIKYNQEAKQLKALEQKLAGLISEEAKTEMELDDIESLLK